MERHDRRLPRRGDLGPRALGRATSAVLLALLAACGAERDAPDVLLVVIDTLRADHCSAYGYRRATTPHLDRLADEGALFEVAYAPMSATSPACATLLTGRHPVSHGLVANGLSLPPEEHTLAELFRDDGYLTAGFVSSFPFSSRFGFDDGFDHFDDAFEASRASYDRPVWEGERLAPGSGFDRTPRDTTAAVLEWLGDVDDRAPLFLMVHHFDPHAPHDPPARHRVRFEPPGAGTEQLVTALYDAEIAYVDEEVGRLVDEVRRRRGDDTIIVVTADHGEALWEHGEKGHNRTTYEEELRIPLVLTAPGRVGAGQRVRQPAHLVDLAPTLASLAHLSADEPSWQGIDLTAFVDGAREPDAERPLFLQRPYYPGRQKKQGLAGHGFGLRVGPWKYFEAREEQRRELYDLRVDPFEQSDLARSHGERADACAAALDAWLARHDGATDPVDVEIPEDALEGLRALGYLGEADPAIEER